MGLLTELENEVQRREDLDAEARSALDAQEARFREELVPATRSMYQCLDQLSQHLNFLKRQTSASFEIPGYGQIVGSIAPEYEVSLDESAHSVSVQLQGKYEFEKDQSPIVEILGEGRVRSLRQLVQDLRLASGINVVKDADKRVVSATFQLHGSLMLQANLSAKLEDTDIQLRFTNFDELGERHRRVAPERVNEEFLDKLARFVSREDNDLLKEDISSDLRRQLKRQVEMNRLKRKWEDKMTTEQPAVQGGPGIKEGVGGMARRVASLGSNLKLKFGK